MRQRHRSAGEVGPHHPHRAHPATLCGTGVARGHGRRLTLPTRDQVVATVGAALPASSMVERSGGTRSRTSSSPRASGVVPRAVTSIKRSSTIYRTAEVRSARTSWVLQRRVSVTSSTACLCRPQERHRWLGLPDPARSRDGDRSRIRRSCSSLYPAAGSKTCSRGSSTLAMSVPEGSNGAAWGALLGFVLGLVVWLGGATALAWGSFARPGYGEA